MGFEDYISENEAAALAGISLQTLNRFAETGCLRVESDSDGLRLFSKSELRQLFQIDDCEDLRQSIESENQHAQAVNADLLGPLNNNSVSKKVATLKSPDLIKGSLLRLFPSKTEPKQSSAAVLQLEQEIVRLKNINDLLERVLDLREQELSELRRERDWLRSRVEKLETKSDRDQVLLLSETQALHRLISQHESKRSPLRVALTWLGFSEKDAQPQQTNPFEIPGDKH